MLDPRTYGLTRLPICTREVLSRGGDTSFESEVFCPLRDCSLTVAECQGCEDYAGISVESSRSRSAVMCHRLTVDSARQLGVARPLLRESSGQPSPADRTFVTEVMERDVVCAREDLGLEALIRLFLERNVSGVPVIDSTGRPTGVVSKTDLLRERDTSSRVADIMTPLAFTLPERASVAQAAALMACEGIHRLPVVSGDGKVIGLVTSLEILRWIAQWDGYLPHA